MRYMGTTGNTGTGLKERICNRGSKPKGVAWSPSEQVSSASSPPLPQGYRGKLSPSVFRHYRCLPGRALPVLDLRWSAVGTSSCNYSRK